MMRTPTYCLLVFMILLAAGCATRVNVDYDQSYNFAELHSYLLLAKSDKSSSDTRLNSPLIDKRIAKALEENLTAKGFVLDSRQPDFAVTYQLNLKHEIASDTSGVSMVFGTGIGRRGGFGLGYSVPAVEVESEELCMLTIDIVDPSNNALLWRGTSNRRLANGGTPAKADVFFKELVAEILSQFPPR